MEKEKFTIKELCGVLEVSRSGYYAYHGKEEGVRRCQDVKLMVRIETIFGQSRRTYGTRRVRVVLSREGQSCSRRRISRLMKAKGLCALRKGRFRPRTTDSRHNHPIAPNLLLAQADVPLPRAEQIWTGDITYLPTGEGWHYLAAELKLNSRRVVGWKTSPNLESTLVEGAFSRALFSSGSIPKIHHSDRGSQYAAGSFRSLLHSNGVTQSMSRRANCPAAAGLPWNLSGLLSKPNAFMLEPLLQGLKPIGSSSITSKLFIIPAAFIAPWVTNPLSNMKIQIHPQPIKNY